jgi:hypothetical protein
MASLLTALALGQFLSSSVFAGSPVYPDLVPMSTARISVDHDTGKGHYYLRFDSTTANLGGPLEIVVPSLANRQIYQKIYDAKMGGKVVLTPKIGADIIFHPTHNHFHFSEFNDFSLVKRDSKGVYRETSKVGTKSSFCILDLMRVASGGPSYRTYGACGATKQGLSPGWADIYDASLPGQYIDLGSAMLPDGMYGIRSTADPSNKLFESNDNNNTLVSYFSVVGGRLILSGGQPPLCSAAGGTGSVAGPAVMAGQNVSVTCSGQKPGESVQFFWGSANTTPKKTILANANGVASTTITVPVTDLGVHYIIGRGMTTGIQSAAVVNVIPSMSISPTSVKVGGNTQVTLRGFSPGETVDIGYFKTSTQRVIIGNGIIAPNGGGLVDVNVPASVYGKHNVDAVGRSSGQKAIASVRVRASVSLNVLTVEAGDDAGLVLRGFAAGEIVSLSVTSPATNLGQIVTSYSGSSRTSTDRVVIPPSFGAGTYEISATGASSGAIAVGSFTVSAVSPGSEPSPTPTSSPTETATSPPAESPTATIEPTGTATDEPSATETATSEPTATETQAPGPTATVTATESPPTATDVPTETATPSPTAPSPP